MCQIPSMASPPPNPNPNPKPLNPHAVSFNPKGNNEPVLTGKHIYLPRELFQQPPVVPHGGLSYYPSYMCEPVQVWCPSPHVVSYHTSEQPRPNIMPYYVGGGDREPGTEKVVKGDVEGSARILGCGERRKVGKGMRRVVEPRSMRSQRSYAVDRKEKIWVPKKGYNKNEETDDGGVLTKKANEETDDGGVGVVSSHAAGHEVMLGGKTSIMIRNIPNQFRRRDMLRIIDKHCLIENRKAELNSDPARSAYDLLYLPMDFGFGSNLGYAFVNFTNAVGALRFCKFFHKHEWKVAENKKTCEISWAKYQGKRALCNHFAHMKFSCHTDGYLPVVFSPPRDGLMSTRPTIIGRRVHSTPLYPKMEMLMIRRRKTC